MLTPVNETHRSEQGPGSHAPACLDGTLVRYIGLPP